MVIDELLAEVDRSKEELVETVRDLIRIPTVNTGAEHTGNETEACVYIRKKLKAEKIDAEIFESEPNRGSIIASLPGRRDHTRARLLFLSHLDVVPAGDEKRWTYPPFGGVIHDGRIYGRGAWDCKGLTACQLMAMITLKRRGVKLDSSLLLASTADEETASGGKAGLGYLVSRQRGRVESDYVINEGGGACMDTPDGLYYFVGTGEKGRAEVTIEFAGTSCHAAQPWSGRNPLSDMAQAIAGMQAYEPELRMERDLLEKLYRIFRLPGHPGDAAFLEILERDFRESRAYSQLKGVCGMTIAPTIAAAGYKANVVPEKAHLTADVRTVPGQDESYIRAQVERMLAGLSGYQVTIGKTIAASSSRIEPYFLKCIADALARITSPAAQVLETLSIGYTDSSVIRQTGAMAYGFEPAHPLSDPRLVNFHGTDESIAIADLVFRTQAYVSLCHDMLLASAKP